MQILSTSQLLLGSTVLSNSGQNLYLGGGLVASQTFSKSTVLYNKDGIAGGEYKFPLWRAPFSCNVTGVHVLMISGSNATGTFNARKNFISNHLVTDLRVNSTGAWISSGVIQNSNYVAGDTLETRVIAISGTPLSLSIQVDYTSS